MKTWRKGDPKANRPSVLDRFKAHAVGEIGISAMTLGELEYGVSASSRPAKNREALDQFISPLDVAPFDRDATAASIRRSSRNFGIDWAF